MFGCTSTVGDHDVVFFMIFKSPFAAHGRDAFRQGQDEPVQPDTTSTTTSRSLWRTTSCWLELFLSLHWLEQNGCR
jgi:hypothetical protein